MCSSDLSELNLKLDGDYFSTELPIARAAKPTTIDENKTIVGIAISMTPKNVANSSSKPYAYGIFELEKAKNPDNLKIRVIDGYTYRISCSMIANAKDSILAEGNSFAAPFDLERSGTIKGECLNKFLTAEQVDGAAEGVYTTIPLGILLTQTTITTVCSVDTPVLSDFASCRVRGFSTKKKMRFVYQIQIGRAHV